MDAIANVAAGTSLAIVIGMIWVVRKLQGDLRKLKRDWYYHQQSVKGIPQEIHSAVDPLRIHLASLAEGKAVSPELIRTGRLYQEISGSEAAGMLEDPTGRQEICLLDVRSPLDFAKQRIPGSILIPIEQLDSRFQAELRSIFHKIIVYCGDGDRSRLACDFLSRQGLTNIFLLRGGISGWPGLLEGDRSGPLIQITSKKHPSTKQAAS